MCYIPVSLPTRTKPPWLLRINGLCALPNGLMRRIDVLGVPFDELPAALIYFTGNDVSYTVSLRTRVRGSDAVAWESVLQQISEIESWTYGDASESTWIVQECESSFTASMIRRGGGRSMG